VTYRGNVIKDANFAFNEGELPQAAPVCTATRAKL